MNDFRVTKEELIEKAKKSAQVALKMHLYSGMPHDYPCKVILREFEEMDNEKV